MRMSGGKLKGDFSNLSIGAAISSVQKRRKGAIVKKDDLMDATRYLIVSGLDIAKVKPDDDNCYVN